MTFKYKYCTAGSACPICLAAYVTDDKGSRGLQGYSQISMRLKPLLRKFKIEVSVGFHDKQFVKIAESRINELNMGKGIECDVTWNDISKGDYLVTICKMNIRYQNDGQLIESLGKFYRMTYDWKPWKLTSFDKVIQAVYKLMTMIKFREFSYDLAVVDHKYDIIIKNRLLPSKKYRILFNMEYNCWTCLSEIVIMLCGKKVASVWTKVRSGRVYGDEMFTTDGDFTEPANIKILSNDCCTVKNAKIEII